MDASRSAAANASRQSQREADLPLAVAVRELFSNLRAGAADVADLVAAEAHVALRLLTAMVLSAVGAAVLGIFGLAGLLVAIGSMLVERGFSATTAIVVGALGCIVGSAAFMLWLRVLARRALFGRSRGHLRGKH